MAKAGKFADIHISIMYPLSGMVASPQCFFGRLKRNFLGDSLHAKAGVLHVLEERLRNGNHTLTVKIMR